VYKVLGKGGSRVSTVKIKSRATRVDTTFPLILSKLGVFSAISIIICQQVASGGESQAGSSSLDWYFLLPSNIQPRQGPDCYTMSGSHSHVTPYFTTLGMFIIDDFLFEDEAGNPTGKVIAPQESAPLFPSTGVTPFLSNTLPVDRWWRDLCCYRG